jgi:o-succinylbenzoate synthase
VAQVLADRFVPGKTPVQDVPVNALVGAATVRSTVEESLKALRDGFTTIKVKSVADPARDIERLRAVRDALGTDADIRFDANASWNLDHALSHLRSVEPLGLDYVEQPVAARPLEVAASLTGKSRVPIALDETVLDESDAAWIIHHKGADVLVLKPQRLGGADRVLRIAHKAHDAGIRSVITSSLESAVGRTHALHAASLLPQPPAPCGLATGSLLKHDLVRDAPAPSDGRIRVPTTPGLGFDARDTTADVTPLEDF